jgi:general secretion pathway protein A
MHQLLSSDEHKAMLESFFGFCETPFGVTPDPRFFYGNHSYLEGLAALVHGIQAKKGLMLVTGEVGTGKTILIRTLMRHLEANVQFVFVSNSHVTSYGLVELLLQSLGLGNKDKNRLEMIQDLNEHLMQQLQQGRSVALIVDEGQKLSDEALEGLCDLSNLETEEAKLLQIVLVGQPELATKLGKSSLRRIKQRIAVHHRIGFLQTINDVESYIRHRLEIVGYDGLEIFSKEAIEAIWHYSSGTPRVINIICDSALTSACTTGKKRVSAYLVMRAAGALLLERESEAPKIRGAEVGLFRPKSAAARINPKKTETNGHEIKAGNGSEVSALPERPAEPVALDVGDLKAAGFVSALPERPAEPVAPPANGSAGHSVAPQLFEHLTRAAIEAMGPMADFVLRAHISALGESRNAFPEVKLGRLIESVSREILNESMRARFQAEMHQEMSTPKTP